MTNFKSFALDPNKKSSNVDTFEAELKKRIVGQDEAIEALVRNYQTYTAGLTIPGRPISNVLFLGPTGTGKTHIVETMSEIVHGENRVIKIDCGEFQHSHEIAKLIGSPPGYLGHRETHPLITQERINGCFTDTGKFAILLFDEIEKASDALWQLLLGIMDKATLTTGDNRRIDLSQCFIIMTSNLGSGEMSRIIEGGFGFSPKAEAVDDSKLSNIAVDAAKRKFTPEFMNRIDDIVVFKSLTKNDLYHILEIELGILQQRILKANGNKQFVFTVSQDIKDILVKQGFDAKYNARHLKRTVEKLLLTPFARMVSSEQLNLGDFIKVELNSDGEFEFIKAAENVLIPVKLETHIAKPKAMAAVAPDEPFKQAQKLTSVFDRKGLGGRRMGDVLGPNGTKRIKK